MSAFRVKGLIATTFTPFDNFGGLVLSKIEEYCRYLADAGVRHVYVNWTHGELTALSVEERKTIAAEWMRVSQGRLENIIICVGCDSLRDTIDLTKHAAEIGAQAIVTTTPLPLYDSTVDSLVEYNRLVGQEAPTLPLYYYHSAIVGDLDIVEFLRKARDNVPSLRGMKLSPQSLSTAGQCIGMTDSRGDTYNILVGCDQKLLSALVLGADGAIGSTYNIMPGVYQRMIEALDKNDKGAAKREQYRLQSAFKLILKYVPRGACEVACLKAMLSLAGLDVGPPRFPLIPLNSADTEQFRQELEDIGFFLWYRK